MIITIPLAFSINIPYLFIASGLTQFSPAILIGTHEEVDNFVRDHRIKKGYPLPSGNTKDLLTMPLPLNVIKWLRPPFPGWLCHRHHNLPNPQ